MEAGVEDSAKDLSLLATASQLEDAIRNESESSENTVSVEIKFLGSPVELEDSNATENASESSERTVEIKFLGTITQGADSNAGEKKPLLPPEDYVQILSTPAVKDSKASRTKTPLQVITCEPTVEKGGDQEKEDQKKTDLATFQIIGRPALRSSNANTEKKKHLPAKEKATLPAKDFVQIISNPEVIDAPDDDEEQEHKKELLKAKCEKECKIKEQKMESKSNRMTYLVDSIEEAHQVIKEHEDKHNVKYSSYYCSRDFGRTDFTKTEHKVYWEDEDIHYSGTPFCIVGRKKLDCQHGKDRNVAAKKRRATEKIEKLIYQGSPEKPTKFRSPFTKKHGCPARISMKEIIKFPELKIEKNSKFRRDNTAKKMKQYIRGQAQTTIVRKIFLSIADVSVHANHDVAKVIETGPEYLEKLNNQLYGIDLELEELEIQLAPLIDKKEALVAKRREVEQTIQYYQPSPKLLSVSKESLDWSSRSFFWTEEVEKALKNVFRLEVFRKLQRETINATIWGKDCILVMPSGAGKSLCFQLPAAISDGFTLVISPLNSLIQDQVLKLINVHINAASLTSTSIECHVNDILMQMSVKESTLKILYVTPDVVSNNKEFMESLLKANEAGNLSRIVIDEVHCASKKSHDYMFHYGALNILKQSFSKVPVLGLTSTATEKVVEDLKSSLGLEDDCLVFRSSFNRSNLFYEVRNPSTPPETQLHEIAGMINNEFCQLSGLVYCLSSKEAELVSAELVSRGVNAGCYHADLEEQAKETNYYNWISNELQVIVCTSVFGVGIDKPNVRFVIHYTMSKSIQNYYQETGRAGRDGNPAKCILYYKFADVFRHATVLFNEKLSLRHLHNMLESCIDLKACRRTLMSLYLDDIWDRENCNSNCDNCVRMNSDRTLVVTKDVTRHAKDIFRLLEHAHSINERLTPFKIVSVWMGKGKPELRVPSLKIPNYSRETCEQVVAQLILNGALTEEFHLTACSTICYLCEGPKKFEILNGDIPLKINCEDQAKKRKYSHLRATMETQTIKSPKLDSIDNPEQKKKPSKRLGGKKQQTRKKAKKERSEVIQDIIDEGVIDQSEIDQDTLKFQIGPDGQSFIVLDKAISDHNEYTSQLKFITTENEPEAIVLELTS